MKKENVTCIQRVKVVFPLHNDKQRKRLSSHFLGKKQNQPVQQMEKGTDHTMINSLHLLSKYFQMMNLLKKTHQDWLVYRTKKKLVMETTTFDESKVAEILTNNGFRNTDYRLEVEYERKWGML